MNEAELKAMRERNERRRALKTRTTPGTWVADNGFICAGDFAAGIGVAMLDTDARAGDDAPFIAAAHNDPVEDDVDALLDEVAALQAERDALAIQLAALRDVATGLAMRVEAVRAAVNEEVEPAALGWNNFTQALAGENPETFTGAFGNSLSFGVEVSSSPAARD